MVRTNYANYIPPVTGRKFSMTQNADGTISLTDVTQYTQVGDIWGAGDANVFGKAINDNAENIETRALKSIIKTAILTASGWVGNVAPYTQTVAVSGITANTNGVIDFEHAGVLETEKQRKKAWNCVNLFENGNGTIKFTCLERLPEIDLPLEIMVLG